MMCGLRRLRMRAFALPVLVFAMAGGAMADDIAAACRAPGWDMSRELAAFRGVAPSLSAGGSPEHSPAIALARVYSVRLRPQSEVRFLRPPGKASELPSPLAGLARFSVTADGKYRVTVDSALWIDVVAPQGIVQSSAFNGWHQCSLFRKSVEYILKAVTPLVLQLSGATMGLVKVAVEPL